MKGDWRAETEEAKRLLAGLRDRPGIHSSMLAERTGISQPQIWRLLNGQFKRPSRGVRKLVEYSKNLSEYSDITSLTRTARRSKQAVIRAALQT